MRARTVLVGLAITAVSAGLLGLPNPTQAATLPFNAAIKAIPAPTPKAMREANGHLFVSTDNRVLVLSQTGVVEKTITAMFGAAGMDVSPDGSTVYVALSGSGQVAVIDSTTLNVTSTWTTAPCTTSVALSGETLFYSYGCTLWDARIGAMFTGNGSAQETGATDSYLYPPMLAVAGATLLAGGMSPQVGVEGVSRYDISGSTLTVGTDVTPTSNFSSLAASPDGTSMGMTTGAVYELVTRNPGDLTQTATFDTGPWPTAVAFSHDSQLIAAGLHPAHDDALIVFNRSTGEQIVSAGIKLSATSNNMSVLSDTLAFNDDDSLLFGIAGDWGDTQYLVSITTGTPVKTPLTLTVKSPAHVGKSLVATAATGVPNARVKFTADTTGIDVNHKETANSSGVAKWTWAPRFSGTIKVTFMGDATHLGASRTAEYEAVSKTTAKLKHGYKHRVGITYFKSVSRVVGVTTVQPAVLRRAVVARLYARRDGQWVSAGAIKLQHRLARPRTGLSRGRSTKDVVQDQVHLPRRQIQLGLQSNHASVQDRLTTSRLLRDQRFASRVVRSRRAFESPGLGALPSQQVGGDTGVAGRPER